MANVANTRALSYATLVVKHIGKIVYVRGTVPHTTGLTTLGSIDDVDYRPSIIQWFPIIANNDTIYGTIHIRTDGSIDVRKTNSDTTTTGAFNCVYFVG